ncbi:unnamed protein product [Effrenium voratum]|nr:unnamed protein product [Effrenium voratum]
MKRTPQTNAGSLQAMGYLGFLAHNTTSSSTPPPFRGPWLWPAMWGTAFLPLAAASGCSWAPLPGDEDFRDGPPTVERRFTRCAVALDAAGGHQSGLFQTLAFGAAPDVSVFSDEMVRTCSEGLIFKEVFINHRYLAATEAPEMARLDGRQKWVRVGACVPKPCGEVFADLALPRLLEWRGKSERYHPAPGPCASEENSEFNDGACYAFLNREIFWEHCMAGTLVWRLLSDASFFDRLFGAQIRSLPEDELGASDQPEHQQAALAHYKACRLGGGSYFGVHFNAMAQLAEGYELGMCLPSLHTSWSPSMDPMLEWWLGSRMSRFPDIDVDADSVQAFELVHRSELGVRWAVVGLGRSGTTSLAAWLDTHPRLQLLHHPGDFFREGSFEYLFRRSHLEHLVRKAEIQAVKARPGVLVGIKEPSLLRSDRGRQMLAEMKRTKVLIIVKNWADWLKSSLLFATPACTPESITRLEDPCPFAFQEAHVLRKVQDLHRKGVSTGRIKVVHLDALLEEGPTGLQRIAAFLGAGNRTHARLGPMGREGNVAEKEVEFWEELCSLPKESLQQLERQRNAATDGLADLLRRSSAKEAEITAQESYWRTVEF